MPIKVSMPSKKDLESLCKETLTIVKKASKFILSEHGKVTQDRIEVKERNSLVSYVDKTAEEILVKDLSKLLPEAEFLTEEGTVAQNSGNIRWIIDPLDGTTNFLHNIPHYAVSVGLEIDNEIVMGIVEHVPNQEQYYAWKGGGAHMNGSSISVNKNTNMADAVVATGFPYHPKHEKAIAMTIMHWMRDARSIRRFGAAALDLVYVARGLFDFYYELSLNAWDIAGGAIIVEEAGGTVSDFVGDQSYMDTGMVVASNGALHPAILKQLDEFFGTYLKS